MAREQGRRRPDSPEIRTLSDPAFRQRNTGDPIPASSRCRTDRVPSRLAARDCAESPRAFGQQAVQTPPPHRSGWN